MPVNKQAASEDDMLGQRVKALRKRHHLSQETLARMVGTSPSQISLIENSRSKPSLTAAIAIAQALGASLDFLTGAVDDNRRAAELVAEIRKQHKKLYEVQAGLAAGGFGEARDFRGVSVYDTVVGSGRTARRPAATARVLFPETWLRGEGLNPKRCEIMGVVGQSMAPTLPDGCSILVNKEVKNLENDKVFVVGTGGQHLARRALEHKTDHWLLSSDNPDKKSWPTIAARAGDPRIVGEVRWVWHSLP